MIKQVLKISAVLLGFVFVTNFTFAQKNTSDLRKVYSEKKQLYGFENLNKEIVIPCVYSQASDFNNGLAIVQKKNKYGIINTNGKEIAPFIYQYIEEINDLNKYIVFQGDINEQGKPTRGLYGLLDSAAKVILPIEYTNIYRSNNVFILEKYRDQKKDSKYYGIANRQGKIIAPVTSYEIPNFNNGLCVFSFYDSNLAKKSGLINSDGEVVIPFEWFILSIEGDIIAGLLKLEDDYCFMKTDGSKIVNESYDSYTNVGNGLLLIKNGASIGLLNSKGILVPCEYDEYTSFIKNETNFTKGTIIVRKGAFYGAYNSDGKQIIQPDCDVIYRKNNGFLEAKKNAYVALYSTDGKQLVPYSNLVSIFDFNDGLAKVLNGNYKAGYINLEGQMVVECKFDVANGFKDGFAEVEIRNVYKGKIDTQGKYVSENMLESPEYLRQEELRKHFHNIFYNDICTAYLPDSISYDKEEVKDFGKTRLVASETNWGTVVWFCYTVYNEQQVQLAKAMKTTLMEHTKQQMMEIMDAENIYTDNVISFKGKYDGSECSFSSKKGINYRSLFFQKNNIVFFLAVGSDVGLPVKDYYDYFINSFSVK